MNCDSVQSFFAIRELPKDSVLIRPVGTLKDPIAERLRQQVLRLMGDMEQKELVSLCGSPLVRIDQVHKFVKGDLQFPPLSFLDTVLKAFGSSLREALEMDPPIRPIPITRADVLGVARLLAKRSGPYVEATRLQEEEVSRALSRGGGARSPTEAGGAAPSTRGSRGTSARKRRGDATT